MINICPRCQENRWNKTVQGAVLRCPCGHCWPFRKGPLFILSGCSGVGKTTTGMAIMGRAPYVTLDVDMFDTTDPAAAWVEDMLSLSRNIAQSGQTVLWTCAGCLDQLPTAYNAQFFTRIHVLALTCDPDELRRRMMEGRGITDEDWLNSSLAYNEYLRTHDHLGSHPFDSLNIPALAPDEAAAHVIAWVESRR